MMITMISRMLSGLTPFTLVAVVKAVSFRALSLERRRVEVEEEITSS